jgi:MinD-like ATPase involved in chromosome partitioning or flagellar assembly
VGRIPHGIEGEDRIAFGLSASRLGYLLLGAMSAYVIYFRPWPWGIRVPILILLISVTLAVAFLRFYGQPLEQWILAAAEYYFSRRSEGSGPALPSDRHQGQPIQAPQPSRSEPRAKIVELPMVHTLAEPRHPYAEEAATPVSNAPVFLPGTQRIIFYSTKGGVGRTTLATEVACILARHGTQRERADARPQPLRVVLADFDLASANVSTRLGLAQPTLIDFLSEPEGEPAPIAGLLVTHASSDLRVLLGPPKSVAAGGAIGIPEVQRILDQIESVAPPHFLLMDVGSELTDVTAYLMHSATTIYYVMTPTAGAVQDTYRGVEALRRLGLGPKLRYVVNRARGRWDWSEPMSDLQGAVYGEIPFDPRFEDAENNHRPLALEDTGPTRDALFELANHIYPGVAAGPRRRRRSRLFAPFSRLVPRSAS